MSVWATSDSNVRMRPAAMLRLNALQRGSDWTFPPLLRAIEASDPGAVDAALPSVSLGKSYRITGELGAIALSYAVRLQDHLMIDHFLALGADPHLGVPRVEGQGAGGPGDAPDQRISAIHDAALSNASRSIDHLVLRLGVSELQVKHQGRMPLHSATVLSALDAMNEILSLDAGRLDDRDELGRSAMDIARANVLTPAAELLVAWRRRCLALEALEIATVSDRPRSDAPTR